MDLKSRLMTAIPDEALPLFSAGFITIKIVDDGPFAGWTEWNKENNQFNIYIDKKMVEQLSPFLLGILVEHELNHIAGAHFKLNCQGDDAKLAGEIEANWWLKQEQTTLDEISKIFTGREQAEAVNPQTRLQKLGLDPNIPYRAEILHQFLHKHKSNISPLGFCKGIDHTDSLNATAIASVTGISLANTKNGRGKYLGNLYGAGEGHDQYNIRTKQTPIWVAKLMDFARTLIRSTLSEGRRHARPVWVLRQLNIHVPSIKPKWAYKPSNLIILVDTSGSMFWGNILSEVAATIQHLRRHNIDIRLIAGDTKVTYDKEIRGLLPPEFPGGGGTDIVPLFEHTEQYTPKALICVTDTEIPRWPKDMGIPTLWICPAKCDRPPFGEVAYYNET